jgi:iron complex transport system substrate-binding protein
VGEIANRNGRARRPPARIGLAAVAFLWAAGALAGERPPSRIVSLDLCTDQLLIELVDRARIAAVTHLAADPAVSAIPDKARGLAITRGAAEDVLRYDPDLILAGPFGVAASVDLLRRLGRRLVIVPLPQDLGGVRTAVRTVAAAAGVEREGEAMIADFDRRLANLPASSAQALPTAVIYQIGGSVSGPGSLADAALAAAGYRNMAGDYRLTRGGQVPLELLLADPPDLLVLSSGADEYRTALADNLRHPALRLLRQRRASIELPWRHWLCGTPHIVEAVERLAEARAGIGARGR